MKRLFLLAALSLLLSLLFGQRKEHDLNINYDESKVPKYSLPPLLESANGTAITTAEAWTHTRRPEILSLFANLIYGHIPVPESPVITESKIVSETDMLKGQARRKLVNLQFSNDKGQADMSVLMISPKSVQAAPAFLMISFDAPDSKKMQINPDKPTHLNNGWPIQAIIDRGFALITVYHSDLVKHNEHEFRSGSIHPLFYDSNQSFPKAQEWGVLSAIGWGAMRALDYVETESSIDASRVALIGHSKLGKATLWAAAQDERFAMAISIQSGCGGAALWRRKYGETLEKLSRFPHWLCSNSRKFINQEADLPIDQHMLLSLIAPRPLYVSSAAEDGWADPRGEYLSAYHASEVYALLGKKGLTESESPSLGMPISRGDVAYHIREGGHSISEYDWIQYLDFAERHFIR